MKIKPTGPLILTSFAAAAAFLAACSPSWIPGNVFGERELTPQDSLELEKGWDLENLEPYEETELQAEGEYYNSSGFFPMSWPLRSYLTINYGSASTINWGKNVNSPDLAYIGRPYNASSSLPDSDSRKFSPKLGINNHGEKDDDFGPSPSFWELGLNTVTGTGLPLLLEIGGGYYFSRDMAYTQVEGRRFRDRDGGIKAIREGHYLFMDRDGAYIGIRGQVPVYGAFTNINGLYGFTGYSLLIGYQSEWAFWQSGNQYSQIETNYDRIRYGNGLDTMNLTVNGKFKSTVTRSDFIPLGIGYTSSFGPMYFSMSLNYWFGLDDVMNGTGWVTQRFSTDLQLGVSLSTVFGQGP